MGTEVSPDAVPLCSTASRAAPAPHLAAHRWGGCREVPALKYGKVNGQRRGQCPSPGWGLGVHKPASYHQKCCPAAAGFITVGAISTPSLPASFLRLVKVKRGLKCCYSHSVYFAGAQNFLLVIRALLNGNVPAGPGSLQAPVRDG